MQKNKKTDHVYGSLLPNSLAPQGSANRKGRLSAISRACPVQVATGALLLSVAAGAVAQKASDGATTLPDVEVKAKAFPTQGKDTIGVADTNIGRTKQQIRDVPQAITVVTEKLLKQRKQDTFKEALRNVGGISFQAGEGMEEDLLLRGFSLSSTGDIFIDGIRDPGFYQRDSFNQDRLEVLRGSASLTFGRGSSAGAANQVSKEPWPWTQHEVDVTIGNDSYIRTTGDFNFDTGNDTAFRLNAMVTKADNDGVGNTIEKWAVAPAFRWGIGRKHEFSISGYYLDNNNGLQNYGLPWVFGVARDAKTGSMIPGLKADSYYGNKNDIRHGSAGILTLGYIHRFAGGSKLNTRLRWGQFDRNQRGSAIRFDVKRKDRNAVTVAGVQDGRFDVVRRGLKYHLHDLKTLNWQTDFTTRFDTGKVRHELLAGLDVSQEERAENKAVRGPRGKKTRLSTPDSGDTVSYANTSFVLDRSYDATSWGVFAQDTMALNPQWKVIAGLRYDRLEGDFHRAPYDFKRGPGHTWIRPDPNDPGKKWPAEDYSRSDGVWSKRLGVLYQPTERQSYHASFATSFNMSGDTYRLDPRSANTPPEGSENWEIGTTLHNDSKNLMTRISLFHSVKTNERNRDPDVVKQNPDSYLLNGERYSRGVEVSVTGRITPKWELYSSYTWIPHAKVKVGSPDGRVKQGDRPALTPEHSGSVWTTYDFTPQLTAGFGVNFRSGQQPNRNPGWEADSWVTADAMVEYRVSDKLKLNLNVSNLSDKYYADQLYPGHYIPGKARSIKLGLNYRFE